MKVNKKTHINLDSRESLKNVKKTFIEGLTPNQIIDIVNSQSEDQIEDDNKVSFFNQTVSILGTKLQLNLPLIQEDLLDTPYPSYEYNRILNSSDIPTLSAYQISSDKNINLSYKNLLDLFSFYVDDITGEQPGAYIKLKLIVKGGNKVDGLLNKYYIDVGVSFSSLGEIISDDFQEDNLNQSNIYSNMIKIFKLDYSQPDLNFITYVENGQVHVGLSTDKSLGDRMEQIKIVISSFEYQNVTLNIGDKVFDENTYFYHIDYINDSTLEDISFNNLVINSIVWNFPTQWMHTLFVPILEKLIYIKEGEQSNTFYSNIDDGVAISQFLNWERYKVPDNLKIKQLKKRSKPVGLLF